jgi:uncharacterized damage-inducible protein DinB
LHPVLLSRFNLSNEELIEVFPPPASKPGAFQTEGTAPGLWGLTEMKWDATAYIKIALEVSVPNLHKEENEMKFRVMASAVVMILLSVAAFAQSDGKAPAAASQDSKVEASPANTFSTFNKIAYTRIKTILVASAEKMPEENYNFKPTEAVRSYGQIVGHVADAQYNFCALALGDKNPGLKIEQTKTSKADLVAALKDAVAYCDKAYDSMTDASGAQMVPLFGTTMPKLGVLNINNIHDMEHYGNMVTYMRLKNIVPPTSEAPPAAPQKK